MRASPRRRAAFLRVYHHDNWWGGSSQETLKTPVRNLVACRNVARAWHRAAKILPGCFGRSDPKRAIASSCESSGPLLVAHADRFGASPVAFGDGVVTKSRSGKVRWDLKFGGLFRAEV